MADEPLAPDEAAFREDLSRDDYRSGESQNHWAVLEIAWPQVLVWIAPASRPGGPCRFRMRLTCTAYPNRGPTGAFWHPEDNSPLPHGSWPKGRGRVSHVFRINWENGASLYHPFDGLALERHADWPDKYPTKRWTSEHTIGMWLAEFHHLLNCDDYEGV